MSRGVIRALTVLLVLCVAGLAAIVLRPNRPVPLAPLPESSTAAAPQILGQFTALAPPLPAPALTFTTREGEPASLADFHGRPVLVNVWATWCVPCVAELPALDRLQAKLGSELTVLAISEDRTGAAAVDPFLRRTGIAALAVYLDPKDTATAALGLEGLPTSVLVGGDGKILGKLEGAAPWDEPEMVALLRRTIAAR